MGRSFGPGKGVGDGQGEVGCAGGFFQGRGHRGGGGELGRSCPEVGIFQFLEGRDGATLAVCFREVFREPIFEIYSDAKALAQELCSGPEAGFGVDHGEVGVEIAGFRQHFGSAITKGAGGGFTGEAEQFAGGSLFEAEEQSRPAAQIQKWGEINRFHVPTFDPLRQAEGPTNSPSC